MFCGSPYRFWDNFNFYEIEMKTFTNKRFYKFAGNFVTCGNSLKAEEKGFVVFFLNVALLLLLNIFRKNINPRYNFPPDFNKSVSLSKLCRSKGKIGLHF